MRAWKTFAFLAAVAALSLSTAPAQQDRKDDKKQDDRKQPDRKGPPRGFGGFGGPPMGEVRKVLAKFDVDKNGRLDATERKAARKALEGERGKGGFGKGGFGKGGFGGNKGTAKARTDAAKWMRHWLADTDFAGVREQAALARLPAAERPVWQKLWADVEATLKKAAEPGKK